MSACTCAMTHHKQIISSKVWHAMTTVHLGIIVFWHAGSSAGIHSVMTLTAVTSTAASTPPAAPVAAETGQASELPPPTATPALTEPAFKSVPAVSSAVDVNATTGMAQIQLPDWDGLSALEATIETRDSLIVWHATIQASSVKCKCCAGWLDDRLLIWLRDGPHHHVHSC